MLPDRPTESTDRLTGLTRLTDDRPTDNVLTDDRPNDLTDDWTERPTTSEPNPERRLRTPETRLPRNPAPDARAPYVRKLRDKHRTARTRDALHQAPRTGSPARLALPELRHFHRRARASDQGQST